MFARFLFLMSWLLMVAHLPAQAQMERASRLELALETGSNESFDITTLNERGVLVTIRKGGFYANDPAEFRFQAYNTDLKERWTAQFKSDGRFEPRLSYHNNDFLYWLFQEDNTDHIQILRVS
ncbi:MAG: hypothetical protein LH609_08755 [Rudanella sp.]|nr:hypothetical protein [Rudanella sp.]